MKQSVRNQKKDRRHRNEDKTRSIWTKIKWKKVWANNERATHDVGIVSELNGHNVFFNNAMCVLLERPTLCPLYGAREVVIDQ